MKNKCGQCEPGAVAAELAFVESASFLRPVRHLDARPTVKDEVLKFRLAYLRFLLEELEPYLATADW
jgi:hypothetical protein